MTDRTKLIRQVTQELVDANDIQDISNLQRKLARLMHPRVVYLIPDTSSSFHGYKLCLHTTKGAIRFVEDIEVNDIASEEN